jgi:hypothetical protein
MWRHVVLVCNDLSEECNASIYIEQKSSFASSCRLSRQSKTPSQGVCSHLLMMVPPSRIFLPWTWWRYILLKDRFTQELHGVTSQKTAFFIVTAVKTSNLTYLFLFVHFFCINDLFLQCLHAIRLVFMLSVLQVITSDYNVLCLLSGLVVVE